MGINSHKLNTQKNIQECQDRVFVNDVEGVSYYIEHVGVDIYADDHTFVMSCIYADSLLVLEYLLTKDVDKLFDRYELLITACEHGCLEIVDYLNKIGVDINKHEVMLAAVNGGNDKLVKYLCDKKVIFSYDDEILTTILLSDNVDVLKMLHNNNADVAAVIERLDENFKDEVSLKVRAYMLAFKEKAILSCDKSLKLLKNKKVISL